MSFSFFHASAWRCSMLFGICSLATSVGYAAEQPLTFQQVLTQVEQYQAQQGLWQARENIANAQQQQSRLWENPSLSVQQTGFGSGEDRELEINLSQKLDLFGERRAAQQLAKLELSQVQLDRHLYRAQLQLALKYRWVQLAVLQQEQQLTRAQLNSSQALLDATRLRYRAGSISLLDVDRGLMAHIDNQLRDQQLQQSVQIAKRQLAHLWGENSNAAFDLKLENPLSSTEAAIEQHQQNNLMNRSLQLQSQQQQAQRQHLRAQARPNPTLLVGMVRTQSANQNNTEQQLRVGVEIPLTLFNRQQYAQQMAQSKADYLDRTQQRYQQDTQRLLETALLELRNLNQQLSLVKDQQIPLSEGILQKTLQGFQAGKYAMSDVQQANLQLQQQRLQQAQLFKTVWQKALDAESLALGVEPSVVGAEDAIAQIQLRFSANLAGAQ
ncbi:TolC family protein [Acinetobacter sp. ME22]|uniref:TolC family protein n=1 Tax=Acinetobacter sp. ME22 TaxID=2904802 RepID=UPI001EDB672C|nr:TolC family protein [Acinetobacter sp. ME22]MCG2573833.1 TolC family protein [Acinetobacter sp. ME22]